MSQQKRWKFMGMVRAFIESIQQKASRFHYPSPDSSFYRKYRNTSLAILNNFQSLHEAIVASKVYEVPLLHLSVAEPSEEQFVWKFLLNCFENSQILNQGFIFWPQFSKSFSILEESEPSAQASATIQKYGEGKIECYCNQTVYESLKIKQLPANEEQILEVLERLRKKYYSIVNEQEEEKEAQNQKNNQNQNKRGVKDQQKKSIQEFDRCESLVQAEIVNSEQKQDGQAQAAQANEIDEQLLSRNDGMEKNEGKGNKVE